jgi:hypothetical protein
MSKSASVSTSSVNSPPTIKSLVTVNPAFFQEIKENYQELWPALHRISQLQHEGERTPEFYHRLLLWLDEARELVGMHFRLEETYGYFEDPVYADPRFCGRASDLRSEHLKLYWQLSRIVDWAGRRMQNDRLEASIDTLFSRYAAFTDQFREHECREVQLIMDAFADEIGCVD